MNEYPCNLTPSVNGWKLQQGGGHFWEAGTKHHLLQVLSTAVVQTRVPGANQLLDPLLANLHLFSGLWQISSSF